jgi:outer membrane protein TolC
MVMKWILVFFVTLPLLSQAAVVTLNPQLVAERVIKKSYLGREASLKADLSRLNYIKQLQVFDWNFRAETNREDSRFEPFSGLPFNTGQNVMQTTFNLQKNLATGTTVTVDFLRSSTEFDLSTGSILPRTVNIWNSSIGLSQSLWRNYFGQSWRKSLNAQESLYEAAQLERLEDLENLILQGIQKYWTVVTAEASYKEAIETRNRYKTLLANVKRKQSVGFANPGELAQVQAELEAREQGIYRAEIAFKAAKDSFITFLALEESEKDIQWQLDTKKVPALPVFDKFDINEIRPVRIASQRLKSAKALKEAASANQGPEVVVFGQYGLAGVDKNSDEARQEWLEASRPRTFFGIKVQWELGSDWRGEEFKNRSIGYEQENLRWTRLLREIQDSKANLERRLVANHEVTLSLQRQKEFRKKAVEELSRSYQLGRIEIRTLIDAINGAFGNEIEYLRALGEYQSSLAELLAFRDELIVLKQEM